MTVMQFLGILLSAILCGFGVLTSLFFPGFIMYLPYFLVFVLIMLMLVPLLKGFDVFSPIALVVGMSTGFVLGAVLSISNDMHMKLLDVLVVFGEECAYLLSKSLLYVIGGLMTYYFGYFSVVKAGIGKKFSIRPPEKLKYRTVMYLVIAIYAVLGTLSYYYFYVHRMGGLLYLIRMYGLSTDLGLVSEARGASSLGSHLMIAALLLWFAYYPRSVKGKILFWVYFGLVMGVQILSGRIASNTLMFLLSLLIWYRYSTKRGSKIKGRKFVFMGLLILGLGLAMYSYRYANRWGLDFATSAAKIFTIQGFMEKIVGGANVPDIRILTQIMRDVPGNIGFRYGKTFLLKVSVGDLLRNYWKDGHGGQLPPTFMGELYLNWGGGGIIGGMFLFGVSCGLLYKWMLRSNNPWCKFVYAIIVVQLSMLVKGEITSSFFIILWRVFPVFSGLFIYELLVSLAKGRKSGNSLASANVVNRNRGHSLRSRC